MSPLILPALLSVADWPKAINLVVIQEKKQKLYTHTAFLHSMVVSRKAEKPEFTFFHNLNFVVGECWHIWQAPDSKMGTNFLLTVLSELA